MSGDRENLEKQSDSMDQSDPVKSVIEERIRKKQKELQQVTSRIELLLKEKELDEKIKEANNTESLFSKNDTCYQIQNAIASYRIANQDCYLTTADLIQWFRNRKFNENEEKLCRFAMHTIAEENMKGRICHVELNICFASNNVISIRKGYGTQRMVICFDEDDKPVFRWEIKNKA